MNQKYGITLELQSDGDTAPPEWLVGQHTGGVWYHENEHGEPFVAMCDDDELLITGLELGWDVLRLSLKQAESALPWLSGRVAGGILIRNNMGFAGKEVASTLASKADLTNPLEGIIWEHGELLWLCSVLEASLPSMRVRRKEKESK